MTFVYDSLAFDTDIRAERAGKRITDHMLVPLGSEIKKPLLRPEKEDAPCGTPAAFARHRRRKEPIDEACRLGINADNRRRDVRRRHESACVGGSLHRFYRPDFPGVKAPVCVREGCDAQNFRFYSKDRAVWEFLMKGTV